MWQGPAGVEVAVKMLQAGTSEEDTVRFLQEAAINGQFRHPNIVQHIGVVTVGNPVGRVLLSSKHTKSVLCRHILSVKFCKEITVSIPHVFRYFVQFSVMIVAELVYNGYVCFQNTSLSI